MHLRSVSDSELDGSSGKSQSERESQCESESESQREKNRRLSVRFCLLTRDPIGKLVSLYEYLY